MKNVLITPEAERDLEDIADYNAADNPARELSFEQEIRDRCRVARARLS